MWNIVLIVLVIINVVAFAHSVWATYHDWKKNGRANWSFPLLGFFFIPVCILIVIGWPISKLLSKIFENAKERNRKKMFEESKKYQFRNFGFRLKDLPFEPTSGEIIYVENNYNEKINSLIRNNLHYIQKCLDKSRYFKSKFIYVPTLIEDIIHLQNGSLVLYLQLCRIQIPAIHTSMRLMEQDLPMDSQQVM